MKQLAGISRSGAGLDLPHRLSHGRKAAANCRRPKRWFRNEGAAFFGGGGALEKELLADSPHPFQKREGCNRKFTPQTSGSYDTVSERDLYVIFYGLGTQLKPGLHRYDLESFVREYLLAHPELDRSLYGFLMTALEDGYLHRPMRIR